jgi:hypothetical protein
VAAVTFDFLIEDVILAAAQLSSDALDRTDIGTILFDGFRNADLEISFRH